MYHRIADETFDPWGLSVIPSRFAEQIAWLRKRRQILSLDEFANRHRTKTLPETALALTFDDGYACTAITAAPILKTMSIPATVFIAPDLIDTGREFWWDDLQRIILSREVASLSLDGEVVELGERRGADDVWRPSQPPSTARQRAFVQMWTTLKNMRPDRIERTMESLRQQASINSEPRETHRLMNARQVRALDKATISFGSHSLSHASLTSLPYSEMERHIRQSAARCETVTGRRAQTFAYPFGDHDAECEKVVEKTGFASACTTEQAAVTENVSPFAFPRLHVGNWSVAQLKRALRLL
jgi:peptidoglycan/xylan/chitin deacetylase (PgdA/CDA1 family)